MKFFAKNITAKSRKKGGSYEAGGSGAANRLSAAESGQSDLI